MTLDLFNQRKAAGTFSECTTHMNCVEPYCKGRLYRYLLEYPTGRDNDRIALAVLANPSEATPEHRDPTMTRWLNWCKDWGYGWAWTVNVRAYRATHPKTLPPDPEAIGYGNMQWILTAAKKAELVVCGFGKLGGAQGQAVLMSLRINNIVPHALKMNGDGSPCHPLYLAKDLKPFPIPE